MKQKKLKFLVDVGVSRKVEEWLLRKRARSDEKVRTIEKILTEDSDKLPNKFCIFERGRLGIRK